MQTMKHWQDPVNAFLGAWLVLCPWVLGFDDERVVLLDFSIVGVLLVAAVIGAIVVPHAWEEWVEAVLGLWLLASPWILDFAEHAEAMQNAVFCGLVVALLALWVIASDEDYGRWLHRRPAHH